MEIRKKLGAKKAEKSLEISAFLVFSRSDLNRPKDLAGALGIEPRTRGFGDRCSILAVVLVYIGEYDNGLLHF